MQTISKQTLSDTLYCHEIPVLTYRIEYPSFTTTCSQTAAQEINALYAEEAKAAETYCQTVLFSAAADQAGSLLPGAHFPGFQWLLTYRLTYNRGCITSLYLEQYSYMGGAHGNTVRTSDTWDFKDGRRLTLPDFCEPGSPELSWRPAMLQEIERQVKERLSKTPGAYFDDYPVLLRQSFQPAQFYLVPDGIVIYYQPYDIAPYATGLPEFLLRP